LPTAIYCWTIRKNTTFKGSIGTIAGFFTSALFLVSVLNPIYLNRLTAFILLLLPILGAGIGWRLAEIFKMSSAVNQISLYLGVSIQFTRKIIAASLFWIILVLCFYFVFSPSGKYWHHDDWFKFWMTLIIPIVLTVAGIKLFSWANKTDDK
jgi:hypothetical protein